MNNLAHKQHPLAGIEAAANEVLAREDEAPTVTAVAMQNVNKNSQVVIAGFVVHDQDAEDVALVAARQERLNKIDAYRHNRDTAIEMMQNRGIVPLAIVPKTAWDNLCSRSGLFRICPDKDGNVLVSRAILAGLETGMWAARFLLWAVLTSVGTFGAYKLAGLATSMSLIALTITGGILCAVGSGVVIYGEEVSFVRDLFTKLRIKLFTLKSWRTVLKHLLPNGVSPNDSNLYAKVILPQPPADVASVLMKARGLTLHVAAEAKAIAFAEPVGDILRREHSRIMDEQAQQRERERQARHDPIIYVEVGIAVAVIAQFGDFPIEQRVINQVMNSEFLL